MSPIPKSVSLSYLDGLSKPEVFIERTNRTSFSAFVAIEASQTVSRFNYNDAGELFIAPDEIISRAELEKFAGDIGDFNDADLVEMYALGRLSATHGASMGFYSDSQLVLRRGITERVHDILERRPELLHPNLHVSSDQMPFQLKNGAASVASPHCNVLEFLVRHFVSLDVQRFRKLALDDGPTGEMLQRTLQVGKDRKADQEGPSLITSSLAWGMGCLRTATAVMSSDKSALTSSMQELMLEVSRAVGAAAVAQQWQFDRAIECLTVLRRREGLDLHTWGSASDVLAENDLSWACARNLHPVTSFLYGMVVHSSVIGAIRRPDVDGWPELPIARGIKAINATLVLDARLELDSLTGEDLLKLMVLSPKASENSSVFVFWQRDSAVWDPHNPWDLVMWAAKKQDSSGRRMGLELLDSYDVDFNAAMTPRHFNALRAAVTENVLTDAIGSAGAEMLGDESNAPPTRRRARMV